MNSKKYLSTIDGLQERNRFLGLALIVLVVLNVMNLAFLVKAQARTQTVIVPIGGEGMQIGNGKADQRYIRRMARYVTNQLGSYSAGSARLQYQELLQLFAPDKVTEVAKYFDRLIADIERYPSIASNVEWTGTQPLKFTSEIIQVLALKERLVNGAVSERKQVHYCIRYHIEDARFWIDNITERSDAGTDLCFLDQPAAPAGEAPSNNTESPNASSAAPAGN